MTTKFECEVRFMIPDINAFTLKLSRLNAIILYSYEFTDHYYKPKNADPWNPLTQTLRLRQWKKKGDDAVVSEVLFTKIEILTQDGIRFKRAVYPQSKLQLMTGSLNTCQSLLNDLGFQPWFVIEKQRCRLYEIPHPKFRTIQEYVTHLGWSGEVEVEGYHLENAAHNLKSCLALLKIDEQHISYKPLASIYAEKLGLIQVDRV